MAMPDEIDTPRLAVIGVVGTIVIVLLVIAIQVLYHRLSRELNEQRNVATTDQALARYEAEQEEKLHRLGWVDEKTGKVAIPIERAMQLTLRELAGGGTEGPRTPAPARQPSR